MKIFNRQVYAKCNVNICSMLQLLEEKNRSVNGRESFVDAGFVLVSAQRIDRRLQLQRRHGGLLQQHENLSEAAEPSGQRLF